LGLGWRRVFSAAATLQQSRIEIVIIGGALTGSENSVTQDLFYCQLFHSKNAPRRVHFFLGGGEKKIA
jgi:hypothetical protein